MPTTEPTQSESPEWLSGGGEMGALIRAKDWSRTALGPVASWSPALRMMVRFLLANRFPLLLWWGADYISIYNDPYRPVLGNKHPWALGLPVRECWSEIWHILQPLIDMPFHGGPPTWDEDISLEINRHGFIEETHFTIAYSPVPDETAPTGIGGVLATVHEITDKIVAERRIVALRDLGAHTGQAKNVEDACAIAAATLSNHSKDVPFALIYLLGQSGHEARLAGVAGIEPTSDCAPPLIDVRTASDRGWPLAAAMHGDGDHIVSDLDARFSAPPRGPWSDPPHSAVILPIPSRRPGEVVGAIVAGLSARLAYERYYRDFFDLVRTQIATAVGQARAYEEERQRADILAQLDRAKTAFFSNVSHEFRTPLTLMMVMPRINGLELLARIRADEITRTVPVLLLSARAGEEATIEGLASGADEYLIKPFSAKELVARVDALLTVSELRRHAVLAERAHATEAARLLAAAQQATHAREEILAIVSHDLRTPLSTLRAATDLIERELRRSPPNDEHLAKHVATLRRSAIRMERLVDDLLDLASIDAGALALKVHPCDVQALLHEAMDAAAGEAAQEGIDLFVDADSGLPPVPCDKDRILQVLGNLTANAIRFTGSGGYIRLSARKTETGIEVAVTDTGSGMNRETLDHIFDRQWQTTRGGRDGHGLGVSIAKGIVDAHGGSMTVASEADRGSTFTFSLPLTRPATALAASPADQPPGEDRRPIVGGRRRDG